MDIIIVGIGGLATEIYGLVTMCGHDVVGFVAADDEKHLIGSYKNRCPIFSTDSAFIDKYIGIGAFVVFASGHPKVRKKMLDRYVKPHNPSFCYPNIIHHSTIMLNQPDIGVGNTIMPNGTVMPTVAIGDFNHFNAGVFIGHDCVIGNSCVINFNAGLAGGVQIGDEVLIGAGATILENRKIGDGATIGAGAVVTKDVPDGATYVGVPAKEHLR